MICQRAPIPQAKARPGTFAPTPEGLITFKQAYQAHLRHRLEIVNLCILRLAVMEGVTMEELMDLYRAAKEGHL